MRRHRISRCRLCPMSIVGSTKARYHGRESFDDLMPRATDPVGPRCHWDRAPRLDGASSLAQSRLYGLGAGDPKEVGHF
jgi:hypothetical protein